MTGIATRCARVLAAALCLQLFSHSALCAGDIAAPSGRRYLNEVFADYVRTPDVVFGEALNDTTGRKEKLTMRVFEPKGDKDLKRVLLVLTPGGGFLKHDEHWMDDFAAGLARSGYVVGVNRYRLSDHISTAEEYLNALFKAFSDQKAAIRFFVKDAQGPNRFRVDVDNIFVGGHSAGAATSMHVAYLDAADELDPLMKTAMNAHGGIDGETSVDKTPYRIRGVINLSGFVTDLNIFDKGEPPLLSLHGDNDTVVAIGTAPNGLHGSLPIHERAESIGLSNELHIIKGALHNDTSEPERCPECVPLVKRFMFNTSVRPGNPAE